MGTRRNGFWDLIGSALVAAAMLAGCKLAFGQDGIIIRGDIGTIKVEERIVTITYKERTLVKSLPFELEAPKGGASYVWETPHGLRLGRILKVDACPKGDVTFKVTYAWITKGELEEKLLSMPLVIGELVKPPDPKPVDPPVPTDPAPIPEPGLRVLIIFESGMTTPATDNIITGTLVRDYMNAKGAKDTINGAAKPAFRAYDKDSPGELPWIVNAMKRERKSLPWLIVSNPGKGGFEGPLPATAQATLDIIKKYGD